MNVVCEHHQNGVRYFAIGLLLMVNACAISLMNAASEYYIGYVNKTGRDLSGVFVYYGNLEAGRAGRLVKGGTATEGIITLPVPSDAELRWVDGQKTNSVKVSLQGAVPKRLTSDWTLYFVINADGTVQAKAIKGDDSAAYHEIMKGLRPDGEYQFGLVNRTGRDVKEISIYNGDEKLCSLREILVRVKFSYCGPYLPPIPPEVEVRWKSDAVTHAVQVKLDNIPKGFEGRIFLVIKVDNTVEVHPIKNGDDKAAFKVVK
jgi:hypothetical protein